MSDAPAGDAKTPEEPPYPITVYQPDNPRPYEINVWGWDFKALPGWLALTHTDCVEYIPAGQIQSVIVPIVNRDSRPIEETHQQADNQDKEKET